MKVQRLNDVFPDWLNSGGIFSTLQEFDVPWKTDNISGSLDLEYHGNTSGDKIISPLVEKIKSGNTLTNSEKELLAVSILAICGINWAKQWETLSFQYNPIENYSMTERMTNEQTVTQYGKTQTRTDNLTHGKTGTETETPNTTETRTDNLTHGKTGTETETPNTTETTTPNITNGESDSINGFNSSNAVPTGSRTTTSTGTNTLTRTGTDQKSYNLQDTDTGTQTLARTGTDQKSYNLQDIDTGTQTLARTGTDQKSYNLQDTETGTQTLADTGSDTQIRNYLLNRSGNIGVTTSQQMIESEHNLWIWNFFINVVFPDLDRVLTLQIY